MSWAAQSTYWRGKVVVVVSPTPTHPQDFGNRKRIYRINRTLKDAGASIHFVHYASEVEWLRRIPFEAQRAMMQEWDGYYLVAPTKNLHPLPAGSYHTIDEWWDGALDAPLRWLAEKLSPDAVIANYTYLSRALEFFPSDTLRILDTHDRFTGRKEMFQARRIDPEFFYTTEGEEAVAFNRADVVWAIKEEEAAAFRAITGRAVVTVPHCDPMEAVAPRPSTSADEIRFGIIGANNVINRQNVLDFLKAATPVFRTHLPPLRIVIAGTMSEAVADGGYPFVERTGWLRDVADFYRDIDVALIPLEFSTGLKIKLAEALSFGLPIIAHAHAFEGYRAFHPFHRLQSMREIAEACVDVAFSPAVHLDPLRSATGTCQRAARTAFEAGLTATTALLRSHGRNTLVVADAASMVPNSLDHLSLRSYLRYLGYRGNVSLYVPAVDDIDCLLRALGDIGAHRIVLAPQLEAAFPAPLIEELENFNVAFLPLEVATMRHCFTDVWLDVLPEEPAQTWLTERIERIYINANRPLADRPAEVAAYLDGALDASVSVIVVCDRDTRVSSIARREIEAACVFAPPFWGRHAPFLSDLAPGPPRGRYGLTVVIPAGSDTIVRALCDVAAIAGQSVVNVVEVDSDRKVAKERRVGRCHCRFLTQGSLESPQGRQAIRHARLTVDLAPNHSFGRLLVSLLDTAGHVVLSPEARCDADGRPRPASLLSLLRDVHDGLTADALPAAGQTTSFEFDPGWTKIWELFAERAA